MAQASSFSLDYLILGRGMEIVPSPPYLFEEVTMAISRSCVGMPAYKKKISKLGPEVVKKMKKSSSATKDMMARAGGNYAKATERLKKLRKR